MNRYEVTICPPRWRDLKPGDTVVELDGHKAVFVIAKEGDLSTETCSHWDVVVLSSDHPANGELTAYRSNWVRFCKGSRIDNMPPKHQVIRAGSVLFTT